MKYFLLTRVDTEINNYQDYHNYHGAIFENGATLEGGAGFSLLHVIIMLRKKCFHPLKWHRQKKVGTTFKGGAVFALKRFKTAPSYLMEPNLPEGGTVLAPLYQVAPF